MRSSARNTRKPTINSHPMLTRSKLRYWKSQEIPQDLDLLHQITDAEALVNVEESASVETAIDSLVAGGDNDSATCTERVALKLESDEHFDSEELVKHDTRLAECDNESATCTEDPVINVEVTTIKQESNDEISTTKQEPNASSLSGDVMNELRRDLTRLVYLRRVISHLKGVMEMSNCPCDPRDCVGARQRAQSEGTLKKGLMQPMFNHGNELSVTVT
ncbi:unnamed protein product [Cylicocyclus nassatus]|uniref:Uncharacterized protein n=1 Tax=Cylicocyclus nassatus TaxID=53992 RepID=A0AA36GI42_CYLNA|nr:unnamed protein product [Cylicocyclus nassatus]